MEENGIITDRVDLAKHLSDISRNTPRVSFKISYTATDGNLRTDKSFQEFCHYYANNEYLAGIGLLMEAFYFYKQMASLNDKVELIDQKINDLKESLENKPKELVVKKTF
jgi:hypothetical protein